MSSFHFTDRPLHPCNLKKERKKGNFTQVTIMTFMEFETELRRGSRETSRPVCENILDSH